MQVTPLRRTVIAAAFACSASVATAQPAPAAPAAAVPAPAKTVSNRMIAAVTSTLPPPVVPPPPAAASTPVDPTAPPIPNHANIIRLAPVVVQGEKPPVFREKDLYSPAERSRLALQRRPGLNLFPFPFSFLNSLNAGVAAAMEAEEERLREIQGFNDAAAAAYAAGDREDAERLRRAIYETYRRQGPAWENPIRK